MRRVCKYFLLSIILLIFLPSIVLSNAAEPPRLIVLVNNPPTELSIDLLSDEKSTQAVVNKRAWEGYYAFYSSDMNEQDNYKLRVTTKKKSFEVELKDPLKEYRNIITLDLESETYVDGTTRARSISLISLRVLITLIIEAIVFWIFGFRAKRSWIIFLLINLLTQGALNTWISTGQAIMQSYLIFNLIIGEIFVFVVETIAFTLSLREAKRSHIFTYIIVANILSLVLGGFLISLLPV